MAVLDCKHRRSVPFVHKNKLRGRGEPPRTPTMSVLHRHGNHPINARIVDYRVSTRRGDDGGTSVANPKLVVGELF